MRLDPNYITNLAASLDRTQANQQQLTAELSSGVRVNSLSDDPVAAGENVLLLNQIQQDDQFTQSANLVTGRLQVADTALGSVVSQLTTAISLATSANNGTMNATDVKSIANQISGILGEVTTLANSSYQGQYIFAGGQTSAAPFTPDAASGATYNGDADINYLEMPNGRKIQLNVSGSQIFLGPGSSNVFATLSNLVADYSTGMVDAAKAAADTEGLTAALDYVSQQRVTIDNSITQLGTAANAVNNEKMQLTSAQTNLMQADIGQLSTRLALAETQQTALEDVIAQLGSASNSLFSKL